jgi:hypothetical protein
MAIADKIVLPQLETKGVQLSHKTFLVEQKKHLINMKHAKL